MYAFLADVVALLHLVYVGIVILGLLLILLGRVLGWGWVRNLWFRLAHLSMILIVVTEALVGWTCPLTTWEEQLRQAAGQQFDDRRSWVGPCVHSVLFYDWTPREWCIGVLIFATLIVVTFAVAPPRLRRRIANPELARVPAQRHH